MATIKHLSSKNSNYAAAESYLTFQHNEYTGLPSLDEKCRPKLRDSYLLDTLECGDLSFATACLLANRKYGKNTRHGDISMSPVLSPLYKWIFLKRHDYLADII